MRHYFITQLLVSNLNEDPYDYVFGGRRNVPAPSTPALNLTSPPIRLRPEGESVFHFAISVT